LPLAYDDCLRVQSSADRRPVELAAGLGLSDSFHTNGFYTPESSGLRQLLPAPGNATEHPDE